MAVSPRFSTVKEVVEGIEAVRENAAAWFVVDRTSCTADPGQEGASSLADAVRAQLNQS
ncbi:UNVERIFIED_ORG: hypothetical protein ABIB52_004380 [Arthrobacter sp. UYCu721]